MNTLETIMTLIKKKKITEQQFLSDLKLNKSALSDWKKGTTNSYIKHIKKIADYFDVSVDYLLCREVKEKLTSFDVSFERFRETLVAKGLSEKDIENLDDSKLAAIADIIKNFKK